LRTAALVLAILASVFGALGALLAVFFGSFLASISFGLGGTDIVRNALWAVAAVAIGVFGTVLLGRRPRVAAIILVAAAVLGILGTAAFVVGAVLYVMAAGLAFFARSEIPLAASGITAAVLADTAAFPAGSVVQQGVTATLRDGAVAATPSRSLSRVPRLRRRSTLVVAAATLLLIAVVVVGGVVAQAGEQRPATALFDALQKGDDAALAGLLPAAARSGNVTRDAQAALRLALGNSTLAFLTEDWLRSLGPATGTTMAFENLKTVTVSKSENSGVVRVSGVFAPTNPNPLINAALQIARVGFSTDVLTMREGSSWYLDAVPAVRPSPSASIPPTPPSTPDRLRVTTGPTVSSVTAGGATLTWITNKPATSQVLYGPTSQFGSSTAVDPALVTSHRMQLIGLIPSSLYHLFGKSSTADEAVSTAEVTLTTVAPQSRLIPGSYPQSGAAVDSTIAGWHATLRNVTVRDDGSIQMDFDVTIGDSSPWAAQASYLRRSDGKHLDNIQAQGVFHTGSARGSTVKNSLVFPAGLDGYQPYVIKICAPDYCYYPDLAGPSLPETNR